MQPVVAVQDWRPVERQRDGLPADPLTRDLIGQRARDRGAAGPSAPVTALTESEVGVVTVIDCDVVEPE